jgi:hypothetical protein
MTNAILRKPARDYTYGRWHQAGEHIRVCGSVKRATFDRTELVRVKFSDNTEALLCEDELGQEISAADLPKA